MTRADVTVGVGGRFSMDSTAPRSSIDIIGYSERGIVNALFYEIVRSSNPSGLLHALLDRATFPFARCRPVRGNAEILIEQSFSDFGDCDALVMVRADEKPASQDKAKPAEAAASSPDHAGSYYHYMLARRYQELAGINNRGDFLDRSAHTVNRPYLPLPGFWRQDFFSARYIDWWTVS